MNMKKERSDKIELQDIIGDLYIKNGVPLLKIEKDTGLTRQVLSGVFNSGEDYSISEKRVKMYKKKLLSYNITN